MFLYLYMPAFSKRDRVIVTYKNKRSGSEGTFKMEITETGGEHIYKGKRKDDGKEVYISEDWDLGVEGHVGIDWIGTDAAITLAKDY
jgi:hypothetical protein